METETVDLTPNFEATFEFLFQNLLYNNYTTQTARGSALISLIEHARYLDHKDAEKLNKILERFDESV